MKVISVRHMQVAEAGDQFAELITHMCDLPHVVSNSQDQIPPLLITLHTLLPDTLAQRICAHLSQHVQHYVQYVTFPDHHTLINWHQITKTFLDELTFNRTFCDLWRAHVHLLMLHAQANWSKNWDQEQACWFKHTDVCDMLRVQFECWLQEKCFDHDVT